MACTDNINSVNIKCPYTQNMICGYFGWGLTTPCRVSGDSYTYQISLQTAVSLHRHLQEVVWHGLEVWARSSFVSSRHQVTYVLLDDRWCIQRVDDWGRFHRWL